MTSPTKFNDHAGFTLAEMMVSIGVLTLLGLVFFRVLQSGLVLYAKNTAINLAHESGRQGINRLTRDIHASVSVPQLRDLDITTSPVSLPTPAASPTPISGLAVGPMFAAVSFQTIANGPNYVFNDPGGSNLIMVKDNYNVSPGQHMLIPFWGAYFEQDIIKTTASGTLNHTNVFLSNGADTGIGPRSPGGAYAITYYTDRVAYVVMNGTFIKDTQGLYTQSASKSSNYIWAPPGTIPGKLYRYEGGELHFFKQRYNSSTSTFYWQDQGAVARNLTSATPFYTPLNSGGGFNTKYVGVQLTAMDPKSSNRGYKAVNTLLDTSIDYRTAIALTQ